MKAKDSKHSVFAVEDGMLDTADTAIREMVGRKRLRLILERVLQKFQGFGWGCGLAPPNMDLVLEVEGGKWLRWDYESVRSSK
jgi:hypothetical protein